MQISGKTTICGVIGDPIEHSLSPAMHNAAFQLLELDFIYVAFTVTKGRLRDALIGAKNLNIKGLNVTMPHKNAVTKYLDETESTARFVGAVNTILNDKGRLTGYNTDGLGALNALNKNGIDLEGKKLVLLGAGGAGRAIAFHAVQEVEKLVILNRTAQKAKDLAELLRRRYGRKITGKSLSARILKRELEDVDILVNATSVGMQPDRDHSLIDPSWLRSGMCVMDIVYRPKETKLEKDAKSVGARVISGVEMLLYQGASSFQIWTGHPAPVKTMRRAVLNELQKPSDHH